MFFKITLVVILIVSINCSPVADTKTKKEETVEQARMREFFNKYCDENNTDTLKKLEACEKTQPAELKKLEDDCISEVRKKNSMTGAVSYRELRDIECDEKMGDEFDVCEEREIKKRKPKMEPKIAKQIMTCGYDIYKIKHD